MSELESETVATRTPGPPDHTADDSKAQDASPLTRLSKTLRRRALDLVAIGIVIAATLTLGRQMAAWWRTSPESVNQFSDSARLLAGTEGIWSETDQPVFVEFGGVPYHLQREAVVGDEKAAQARLAQRVLAFVNLTSEELRPDATKERLRAAIKRLNPVLSKSRTEVYIIDGPAPVVVGTKRNENSGQASHQIICWGIFYPSGNEQWTTWLFSRSTSLEHAAFGKLTDLLPDSALPVMSLRSRNGSSIVSFRHNDSEHAFDSTHGLERQYMKHFDSALSSDGWRSLSGWHRSKEMIAASYELPSTTGKTDGTKGDKPQGIRGRIDIQLIEQDGQMTGVVHRIGR